MTNPGRPRDGRRGRRPAASDTRSEILRAANELFTRQGYEQTSVRAIARQAGVDPGLIRHYFTDKTALFLAAAQIGFDPRLLVRRLAMGGRQGMGERMLTTVLPIWESPMWAGVIAVARRQPKLMIIFAQVIANAINEAADQTLAEFPPAERQVRVAMLQSAMAGLFTTRYLAELEPISTLPRSVVIKRWAPLLQQIVDGP